MKTIASEIKKGQKEGTIVFIHGNSGSMKIFDPVFQSDKIPYTRVRMDLPGHGDSFRSENPDDYSFENYRSSILEQIGKTDGDILLVGNSLGGHLCMEIAPEVDQLSGLLVFGSPPLKIPLNMEEAFNPVPEFVNMFTEEVPEETVTAMFSKVCFRKEAVSGLVKDFCRADPKVRSMLGAEVSAGGFLDEARIFRELRVPRFLMQGDIDLTPNLDYIKSLNPEENPFEIIELENCGHYPTVDQPEVFIQHLVKISEEVFG